jgi:hypothetical protein
LKSDVEPVVVMRIGSEDLQHVRHNKKTE